MSTRFNEMFLALLDSKPEAAREAITDLVRIYLKEAGMRPLPDGATAVKCGSPDDLICMVEGLVPVYRTDFTGPEEARTLLLARVHAVIARCAELWRFAENFHGLRADQRGLSG
jgi:hypothetical protein